MIAKIFISSLLIFLLFGGWILMQLWGRRFARRHPEFGRFREEGGECGKSCGCADWKKCRKKSVITGHSSVAWQSLPRNHGAANPNHLVPAKRREDGITTQPRDAR
jgi:hypothetical protein